MCEFTHIRSIYYLAYAFLNLTCYSAEWVYIVGKMSGSLFFSDCSDESPRNAREPIEIKEDSASKRSNVVLRWLRAAC